MLRQTWIAAVVVVSAGSAWADVAPPGDAAINTCTVEQQQTDKTECLMCASWLWTANRCANLLAPYCYTKVCQLGSTSAWAEVLCRTLDANAPVVPAATLSSLMRTPSSSETFDGGAAVVPSSCAFFPPPGATHTATGTQTTSNTQTATNTQTTSNTQTATNTQTASNTQTATNTQTTGNTQTTTTPATTSASSTATTTTPPEKHSSSSCSVTLEKSAFRALGPGTLFLAVLALIALRRRTRR